MTRQMINIDENDEEVVLRNALILALGFSLLLRHDELSHITLAHMNICEEGIKVLIP
jgi:site-specific recombinase XerC